ncbi:lipocalin-like domain-containing protein [Bradyrhizobium sp. sGM-13]|uniref:lipocalin-like domain-containing protein n=1 Tax=Bradyrhizobium sp. sGM-13 TaxID=2831781 RepID=UPI001BCD1096|nr:lipocalin-like domain-containing protein [Bradyrhizobium sp. sGM-13]
MYQSVAWDKRMTLRAIFAECAIAASGSFMMTVDALGQKQTLRDQLVGTWTLLSWEQKKGDGTKIERYGAAPKGIAFFDAGGRYIITVMRSDRAKYASNTLWQGTPEENKETADGTITYFGTYSANEADSSIAIHVEGSSFPNWNGTEQKRFVAIAGDLLTLTVRPPAGDVVDVIWKRAK